MFCIQIRIDCITSTAHIPYTPRLYFRMGHFHYFISGPLQLTRQTPLNLHHTFHLPEQTPFFQLKLLVQTEGRRKLLGQATLDAREWPIDQQKSGSVWFSDLIWAKMTVGNSFKTSVQFEMRPLGLDEQCQMESIEVRQALEQAKSQHLFLKQKNLNLKQELRQLSSTNASLQQQAQTKRAMFYKRNAQREEQLSRKMEEVGGLKQELEATSLMMGQVLNLVNDHGQLQICNSVLELMAPHPPS